MNALLNNQQVEARNRRPEYLALYLGRLTGEHFRPDPNEADLPRPSHLTLFERHAAMAAIKP